MLFSQVHQHAGQLHSPRRLLLGLMPECVLLACTYMAHDPTFVSAALTTRSKTKANTTVATTPKSHYCSLSRMPGPTQSEQPGRRGNHNIDVGGQLSSPRWLLLGLLQGLSPAHMQVHRCSHCSFVSLLPRANAEGSRTAAQPLSPGELSRKPLL